jgi:hypothetical protein
MKKLLVISLLLVGAFSFGQTKPKPKTKDTDKTANVVIDSLSKVYKVKVQSYMVESYNGVTRTSISYVKDNKLVYMVISVKQD